VWKRANVSRTRIETGINRRGREGQARSNIVLRANANSAFGLSLAKFRSTDAFPITGSTFPNLII